MLTNHHHHVLYIVSSLALSRFTWSHGFIKYPQSIEAEINWPLSRSHFYEYKLLHFDQRLFRIGLSDGMWSNKPNGMSSASEVSTHLCSTWYEFDPNTAYVVCISICPYFLIWYPYAPTSLYGNAVHCSGYGVAMGCYRLCIVLRTAIVTSQWYDRYCFTEYARTWAKHPTTPWQRECTAITDCQSIDYL